MIKAITFDFWNTLYADRNFEERLKFRIDYLSESLRGLGHKRTRIEIERAFAEAGRVWLKFWEIESRAFAPYDIVNSVLENLGLKLETGDIQGMTKDIGELALKVQPLLVDGAKEFIEEASGLFKIGLISDTGATPGEVLKKIMENDGIRKYFGSFVFSDEICSTKPARINFESALKPLGVKPGEAVHIGDIERTDIAGAKNFGMKAVLFTGVNSNGAENSRADFCVDNYHDLMDRITKL